MKVNTKASEALFRGIENHYKKLYLLLKSLSAVFLTLTLGIFGWIYAQQARMGYEGDTSYLMLSFLLFILLAGMFGIGFYSVTNNKRKNKRDFLYFTDNPDALISYKIIAGEITKLTLESAQRKATFSVQLSPLEVEELFFEVFPNWQKKKEHQNVETPAIEGRPQLQDADRPIITQNIPKALKPYFKEKLAPKFGCLPYICGLLLVGIIMSLAGRFGWYNFWIFDVGNSYWAYFMFPLAAFVFSLFTSKSEDQKIHALLKNPESIIWIYLNKTQSTTLGISSSTTVNLVIADVKGKYDVPLFEKEEETLLWLSLYCPAAVVGFYYDWDEVYKKSPNDFLALVHNMQPHK